jgi:hypothetical protein
MSAAEHLSPEQFVEVHRGVADWNAHDWDGRPFSSAEDWHTAHSHERPGFGQWWSADRSVAEFYGKYDGNGLVVSGHVPRSALHDPKDSTGYVVPQGTEIRVSRVSARRPDGTDVILAHQPGFTIKA